MINFSGKKVVIFGGGRVGLRKARYFGDEADVWIYSHTFLPELEDLPVRLCACTVKATDAERIDAVIHGAYLVIPALSDQDLNNFIRSLCVKRGILCNTVSGERGDVLLPAKISGEKFLLAISTKGGSPAVARFIREYLEENLPSLDSMIQLQERIRRELQADKGEQANRQKILENLLKDADIWKALSSGEEQAYELAMQRYCR